MSLGHRPSLTRAAGRWWVGVSCRNLNRKCRILWKTIPCLKNTARHSDMLSRRCCCGALCLAVVASGAPIYIHIHWRLFTPSHRRNKYSQELPSRPWVYTLEPTDGPSIPVSSRRLMPLYQHVWGHAQLRKIFILSKAFLHNGGYQYERVLHGISTCRCVRAAPDWAKCQ